jgi:hypothetical protein
VLVIHAKKNKEQRFRLAPRRNHAYEQEDRSGKEGAFHFGLARRKRR